MWSLRLCSIKKKYAYNVWLYPLILFYSITKEDKRMYHYYYYFIFLMNPLEQFSGQSDFQAEVCAFRQAILFVPLLWRTAYTNNNNNKTMLPHVLYLKLQLTWYFIKNQNKKRNTFFFVQNTSDFFSSSIRS